MTQERFYPYPTCDGINLDVESIDPPHAMDPNARYLRLWEQPSEVWTLRLTVELPDNAADQVLHESERTDPPLMVAVTMRSPSSRLREVIPIPFQPGESTHDVRFAMSRWNGLVEVDAHLVRTHDAIGTDGGWARTASTVLGRAPSVRIAVDEPARVLGDALDIVWEHFATSPITALNRNPGHLFALRESAAGEPPVLYLNQGIEGAVPTLTSTGSTGPKARTRDATFHLIAHQVWSSVIASSISKLHDATLTDEEATLDEALDLLAPWMRGAIEQWAPWLYPDASDADALPAIWELIESGRWEELLTERMPTAIAARFDTARGFNGLVREFDL